MTGRGEGRNRRIWRKGGVGRDRENESANGGKEMKKERTKKKKKKSRHIQKTSAIPPRAPIPPPLHPSPPCEGETPGADPSPSLPGCRAGQCPGAPGSPAQPHAAGEGGSSPPAASARGTELLREPPLSAPQGRGQRERWEGLARRVPSPLAAELSRCT